METLRKVFSPFGNVSCPQLAKFYQDNEEAIQRRLLRMMETRERFRPVSPFTFSMYLFFVFIRVFARLCLSFCACPLT